MAEDQDRSDKTEDPTRKRLDEAIKRGDVVKSQEVNTWFVFAASALALMTFSNSTSANLAVTFRGLLANAHRIQSDDYLRLATKLGMETVAAVAMPFLLFALAAVAGNMIQHRMVWSAEVLVPKFSKVSPMAGFKRLFSKQALANFVKGLVKLIVVGAILTALLWPERFGLEALANADVLATLVASKALSLKLLGAMVAILAFIAAGDYFFQYRQWYERQKMSLRDVKDEMKDTEGDPKIKARIRQLRQLRARKRMMAAVPKATVVITNPTHFAVALRYEPGMNAPVCVAKGIDALALKIREVATRHRVPVVENPPLARALHATIEVDDEVPADHYKAVAEIIGFVMRAGRRARG
jgi:flagellar biosynthetic protein FlhB